MADQRPEEISEGLAHATLLARIGVPIFLSTSSLHEIEPGRWGWTYPRGWQRTKPKEPSLAAIRSWKPGYALCAVSGVKADFIDIDVQHGGHIDQIPAEHLACVLATQQTPSGGWHLLIHALGAGSPDLSHPGIELKSGLPDGSSRRFIHIAPTVGVSKIDGERRRYQWI